MTKSELMALPVDRFPAIHNLERISAQWYISARVHSGPVLEVTAFQCDKEPVFRVFTDRRFRRSQNLRTGSWGTCKVTTLLDAYSVRAEYAGLRSRHGPFVPAKSERVIRGFLSSVGEKRPDRELLSLERLELLHKKQNARDSEDAKKLRCEQRREERERILSDQPPLPADFYAFADKELPVNGFLFYKKKGKKVTGYCLRCKTDVEITGKVQHNTPGLCPHCNSNILFRSAGLPKDSLNQCKKVSVLQSGKTKHEVFLRVFYIGRDYENYRSMEPVVIPMNVTYMNREAGTIATYGQKWASLWCGRFQRETDDLNHTWTNRRKPYKYGYTYYNPEPPLYRDRSVAKTTAKGILQGAVTYRKVAERMEAYTKYPALEYLQIAGFLRLTGQVIAPTSQNPPVRFPLKLYGKSLPDVFGYGMQEIKMLAAHDPGASHLLIYRKIKEKGYKADSGLLGLLFSIENYEMRVLDALEYASPQKILNYMRRQYLHSPAEYAAMEHVIQTWTDYLQEAVKMKYDLADSLYLFPKDLLSFHRKTSRYVEYLADDCKEAQISRIGEENKHLAYEDGVLLIRPVSGIKELIQEGKVLRHCIGGYAGNILRGECLILVVRRKEKPNRPFYTVEYRPEANKIMQKQGLRHVAPTVEVQYFLEEWLERQRTAQAA